MPDVSEYFLSLMGNTDPSVVLLKREFWIGILGLLVIPTAFLRQLNSLRYAYPCSAAVCTRSPAA